MKYAEDTAKIRPVQTSVISGVKTMHMHAAGDGGHSGPYRGVRVIEIGRFIAVPYAGQLMADAGAEVLKLEPLDGDESRLNSGIAPGEGRQFLNKNRGKRSIALEFRDP